MAAQWFIYRHGRQYGPYSWEALVDYARAGNIGPGDLLWSEGSADWIRADRLPGLFTAVKPGGAPPAAVPKKTTPSKAVKHKETAILPQSALPPKIRRRKGALFALPALVLVALFLGGGTLYLRQKGSTLFAKNVLDLGRAEVKDGDPALIVETEKWGPAPANQVLLLMAPGAGRGEAQSAAKALDGKIVGELEYISLYQVETSGSDADDLQGYLETAAALPGVEAAFPNGVSQLKVTVEGKPCSPLRDPLYEEGDNARSYEMIGLQQAWDILKSAGIEPQEVHVGVVDTEVYTRSGHDFAPELNFPNAAGLYPAGKVKVRGLEDKDTTKTPAEGNGGLSHGTRVAHIIGADPGSGAAGVAGELGDKLTMTFGNCIPGDWRYDAGAEADPLDVTQYQGLFVRDLVEMQKQVEAGATVINLSIGPPEPGSLYEWRTAAYRRFLEKMQEDHPQVLFVAAAGNENGALDGENYGPGGIRLPNLITVGALNYDGERATAGDWHDREDLEQAYEQYKESGLLPAGRTLEEFIGSLDSGSNFAAGEGEVTLAACGTAVPIGVDPQGRPVLNNGTSFAAPQVTAAAALLKSVNPKLTAEEIKNILVETAATEVKRGENKVAVPAGVGGRVLRVDDALLRVINDLRREKDPAAPELIKGELLSLAEVKLTATGEGKNYTITAAIASVAPPGTDLKISFSGEGSLSGGTTRRLGGPGEASWELEMKGSFSTVRVYRLDTGTCALLHLGEEESAEGEEPGTAGSFTGTVQVATSPELQQLGLQNYEIPFKLTVKEDGSAVMSYSHADSIRVDMGGGMSIEQGWSNQGELKGTCADGVLTLKGTEHGSYYVRAPMTPEQNFSDSVQATVTGTVSGNHVQGTLSWEGSEQSHPLSGSRKESE